MKVFMVMRMIKTMRMMRKVRMVKQAASSMWALMLPVMFLERARRKEQDDRLISSHYLMKLGLDIIIASYGKGVSHDDRFIR